MTLVPDLRNRHLGISRVSRGTLNACCSCVCRGVSVIFYLKQSLFSVSRAVAMCISSLVVVVALVLCSSGVRRPGPRYAG
jgi:hypothetical protein